MNPTHLLSVFVFYSQMSSQKNMAHTLYAITLTSIYSLTSWECQVSLIRSYHLTLLTVVKVFCLSINNQDALSLLLLIL